MHPTPRTRWLTAAGVAAILVLALNLALPRVALAARPSPLLYPAAPAPAAPGTAAGSTGNVINLCDITSKLSAYGPVTQKALEPSEGVTQISIGGGQIVLDGFKVATKLGWGLQIGEDIVLLFCNDSPPASSLCLLFNLIHAGVGTAVLFDAAPGVTQLALEGGAILLEGAELATPVGWGLLVGGIALDIACDGSEPPAASTGPPIDPNTIPPSLDSAPLPPGAVSATVCYVDFGVCESVNGTTSPSAPDPNAPTSDPSPVVTSSICDSQGQNCVPADPGTQAPADPNDPPATDPNDPPTTDPSDPPSTDPNPPSTGGGGGGGSSDGGDGPTEMDDL